LERTDLLLVNPSNRKQAYGELSESLSGIEPAFWCGLIAAYVRERGYRVGIIDADAEGLSSEQTAERIAQADPLLVNIVALGTNPSVSSTPKMPGVSELAAVLKKSYPQLKLVLSGLHPSALPKQTLEQEQVDFVCQGEGFLTIIELLGALQSPKQDLNIPGLWYKQNDQIFSNPPAEPFSDLDQLPFVAWDLLPMEKYRAHNWQCFSDLSSRSSYAVIYTSLGCPFQCHYCPVQAFYGSPGIRYRSVGRVVEEIDLLVKDHGIKNIKFMDELFTLQPDRVEQLCELLIERDYGLNIWTYARVDTVNQKLLVKMKQAGINWICYGFESANENVRLDVGKSTSQEKIKQAIEQTKAAGINILANFIFGLPEDDLETMRQTLEMAKKFNFEYVNFYVCMAYPGSRLYQQAKQDGLPLPKDWQGFGQYSYQALPLPTKHLTAEQVLAFRDQAFEEYLSDPEYLHMIEQKFGPAVVKHINKMLEHKLNRKIIDEGLKV